MLLKDIHWADDGSLDLIDQLERACRDLPLLIGSAAQMTLYDRRASWGQQHRSSKGLDLEPLSEQASRDLVDLLV